MIRRCFVLACAVLLSCSSEGVGAQQDSSATESHRKPSASGHAKEGGDATSRRNRLRGIKLEPVVDGLTEPIGVTSARDGSGRLFVIEQGGTIRIVRHGRVRARPFLDISSKLVSGGEQGLLGLAFHPQFKENRRFYVNYTDSTGGDTVIAEYRSSPHHPNRASSSSERVVLTFDQPFPNHNGGHLAFGSDGYLYIATGDGGSGGDPQGNGQRRDTLLGKILRIDVDSRSDDRGYGIPEDNPFTDSPEARPEIWFYGLRNPWRFSFDRETDRMWIGDVGQEDWEEVDLEPASSEGGINWGWNIKEGTHCFVTQTQCEAAQAREELTDPIAEYSHDFGCSVTGGFVYRGKRFDALRGLYFFSDYCSGNIWTLDAAAGGDQEAVLRLESGRSIASFGETRSGEVLVADRGGEILRVVPSN